MKICITYLTFGKDIFGGVEHAIYNLASGLVNTGVEVVVYTGRMKNGGSQVNGINIFYSAYLKSQFSDKVEEIDSGIIAHYGTLKSEIKHELISLISSERPDYILSVDHLWGVVPFIDIWEVECPIGLFFRMNLNTELIKYAAGMPFRHLFCTSQHLKKGLIKSCAGLRSREIHILPNSIQLDEFGTPHPNTNEVIIFCNSRLSPEKGIEFLVEAFMKVLHQIPSARLWLCGGRFHFGNNSKVLHNVREAIFQNQILKYRIDILPFLKWDEVANVLRKVHLVVLPSKDETFGNAALEAMAAGVPLIATNVGNLPDLIQDAGLLVEYGDINSLSHAIIHVLSDEKLAKTMTIKGKMIARRYDHRAIAKQFIEIINGGQNDREGCCYNGAS